MVNFKGSDSLKGKILHSSQLDGADLEGKKLVIIGSGASGVEAAQLAVVKKAREVVVLARDDKWCIPRSTVFDILLALQPFGRETVSSFATRRRRR
jgi:dimethylaniline monooxygenase (N-oxide forming)